jgi:hypothetical protein
MLWVGTACNAFMVVARRAFGEGSAVLSAVTTVALYALVGSGFLLPFSLMLAAARSMASDSDSSSNNTDVEQVPLCPIEYFDPSNLQYGE